MSRFYAVYEVAQYESQILSLFKDLPEAKKYAEDRAIQKWDGYDTLPEADAVVLKHPDYSIGDDDYLPYIKVEPVETITYNDGSNEAGGSPDAFDNIAQIFDCDREFVEGMAEVAFADSADEAGDGHD